VDKDEIPAYCGYTNVVFHTKKNTELALTSIWHQTVWHYKNRDWY